MSEAVHGWSSDFVQFEEMPPSEIHLALQQTYGDVSDAELRSWVETIKILQQTVRTLLRNNGSYQAGTVVLEYQLPMESRRADAVLLLDQRIVVIEFKGKSVPSDADVDQVHAYGRDLRCYHRECHERPVHTVLVPTNMTGQEQDDRNVQICGPDALAAVIENFANQPTEAPRLESQRFLDADVYRPLPTLIQAARDLFLERRPPRLWHSAANTDDAVAHIAEIIQEASRTKTRRLVLLTGVPGAGKTLVGMRIAHQPGLDRLISAGAGIPAVFLSGNGPLVQVLQYVLSEAGGGGRAFVRPIRDYVKRYSRADSLEPPEHVVVFDEAQRAFDRARVADVHRQPLAQAHTEPDYIVEFAERKPDWSVIVGLVGGGQEIHLGEEGGLGMWAEAIRQGGESHRWTVHAPPSVAGMFDGLSVKASSTLSLNTTLRSHQATNLHAFVATLLRKTPPDSEELRPLADALRNGGHDLHITRDLDLAKTYFWERYQEDPNARFGLMASSRDRGLEGFGVPNGYAATKKVQYGPWYTDSDRGAGTMSCRNLNSCVTEFGAQGLEVDGVLLAWGTDFLLRDRSWTNDGARSYGSNRNKHAAVRDAWQLRANAYRVLLTRGREVHLIFVPCLPELDATWTYLRDGGFRPLTSEERHVT